jgi:D-arabinose 1-dehydrogenase
MTKCGRFGVVNFDYSPTTVRESVTRSLSRLQTEYIDTVYLHDVEFVATPVISKTTGNHATALKAEKEAYGLREGDEANVRGDGDQKILDAYAELRKLKDEGLVKHIGITGTMASSRCSSTNIYLPQGIHYQPYCDWHC